MGPRIQSSSEVGGKICVRGAGGRIQVREQIAELQDVQSAKTAFSKERQQGRHVKDVKLRSSQD